LSISSFYCVYFFGYGALFPFLALYLQESGSYSGTQIGLLLSLNPIMSIVAQPLWGMLCDATQRPRAVLGGTVWLTALAALALPWIGSVSYAAAVLMLTLLAVVQSAAMPLIDALTMSYTTRTGQQYGSLALWGAAGFATAVFVVGRLSDAYGLDFAIYSFIVLMVLSGLISFFLPPEPVRAKVSLRANMKVLLRMPRYSLFLPASFLVFGPMLANNFYFGILMKDAGANLTGLGIAFLIAAGTEVPFMKWADRFIDRWGLMRVLIACSILAFFRWGLYSFELPLPVVYATALLQGFSVGLFIPAALRYVYDVAPAGVRATAVSLYSMAGNGLGSWLCTFLGGALMNRLSIHASYVIFALFTAAGLALFAILGRMHGLREAGGG
jgi:PPP family 3-phenylpropionic acid transporter